MLLLGFRNKQYCSGRTMSENSTYLSSRSGLSSTFQVWITF